VLIVIGLLLIRRFYRTGLFLAMTGVLSLGLFSTLVVAGRLAVSLDHYPVFDTRSAALPQAIVVLGAGHHDGAAEYGTSTPTDEGLVRLHYAASLHRRTGLPIMLTGGPMNLRGTIHSKVLATSLERVFGLQAAWLEEKSITTWENALYAAEILLPAGVTDIALVTHSYHMPRAVKLFELAGFNVTPAPTRLNGIYDWRRLNHWLDRKSVV
jgi:uncharacterized SAM-binding protein YcdF (DUF218 family)